MNLSQNYYKNLYKEWMYVISILIFFIKLINVYIYKVLEVNNYIYTYIITKYIFKL